MPNVIPTKGNLIAIKRSLVLARLGYELMDRKRNILVREIMSLIDRAERLQSNIDGTFRNAYGALENANITLGQNPALAENIPVDNSVGIRFRSIMGVEIPVVTVGSGEFSGIPYGLALTNSLLDNAREEFISVKKLTRELAELETSIYRLAIAIKKTQKRANALKNIIIPGFVGQVKLITDALEEKEREEFVRLKSIKSASDNKGNQKRG